MGVSIRIAGAAFPSAIASLSLADRTGLVAEYVLGGSQAKSTRNLANASAPLTVEGSPTYNAKSVVISSGSTGNHGFATGLPSPSGDATILTVRRKPITGNGAGVLVNQTGPYFGFLTYQPGDFYNSQEGTAPGVASLAWPTHGDFFFQAGVGTLGAHGIAYIGNAGSLLTNAGTDNTGLSRSTEALKIGGALPFANGNHEIAYAAMFSRAMSPSEIAAVYTGLKAYFVQFIGLTVS